MEDIDRIEKREEERRKKGERWADATNVPGPRSMTIECTWT